MRTERPPGLAALATLLIVSGVFTAVATGALLNFFLAAPPIVEGGNPPFADVVGATPATIWALAALGLAAALVEIVAAVGLLGLRRVLGRDLAVAAAVLAAAEVLYGLLVLDAPLGPGAVIGLGFPALVALLVLLRFRRVLVR